MNGSLLWKEPLQTDAGPSPASSCRGSFHNNDLFTWHYPSQLTSLKVFCGHPAGISSDHSTRILSKVFLQLCNTEQGNKSSENPRKGNCGESLEISCHFIPVCESSKFFCSDGEMGLRWWVDKWHQKCNWWCLLQVEWLREINWGYMVFRIGGTATVEKCRKRWN